MLARSTGADVSPDDFKKIINSQSPHTWSNALKPYGLQLAYCNHDLRRLSYSIDELIEHDDLFLLCFYSVDPPSDPDANGKLCTAHIVTLHGDKIIDTAKSLLWSKYCHAIPETVKADEEDFQGSSTGHPRRV